MHVRHPLNAIQIYYAFIRNNYMVILYLLKLCSTSQNVKMFSNEIYRKTSIIQNNMQ